MIWPLLQTDKCRFIRNIHTKMIRLTTCSKKIIIIFCAILKLEILKMTIEKEIFLSDNFLDTLSRKANFNQKCIF
jgi:hypothetical protein